MGTSNCFDCGTEGHADAPLWSVTVMPALRQTTRGLVTPPAGSIALCRGCYDKEIEARRNAT